MKLRLFYLLGIGLLFMSETTTAEAEKKLLLETSKGQIEIALLPELAPHHVERISELATTGFYDGIIFHRVIPGFMAQTGDPTGTGMGGSGSNLDAEFTDYEYRSGTVGMARSSNPDSGDSQFFICFDGCGHLTGQYTVWGQVERGMEIVEKLAIGEPPEEPDQIVTATIID
jgi:peptidylprolyl isomerase